MSAVQAKKLTSQKSAALAILEENDDYLEGVRNLGLYNLINAVDPKNRFASKICSQMEIDFEHIFNALEVKFPVKRREAKSKEDKEKSYYFSDSVEVDPKDWETLKEYFKVNSSLDAELDSFTKNIKKLGNRLNLSEAEMQALVMVHAFEESETYLNVFQGLVEGNQAKAPAILAVMTGFEHDVDELTKSFGPVGKFAEFGLIEYEGEFEQKPVPVIRKYLADVLGDGTLDEDNLVEELVGKPVDASLDISNFSHFSEEVKDISDQIKGTIEREERCNILIHGPTGSGKTELAQAIAHSLGLKMYAVGEDNETNTESPDDYKTSQKRLGAFNHAQTVLKGSKDVVLKMDEFEDLVPNASDTTKKADPQSKILLNNSLTTATVPTIWICNDVEKFHPSFLNRFDHSLAVGYQPMHVRCNIWEHHLKENGIELGENEITFLARRYDKVAPRTIGQACHGARDIGGDLDAIQRKLQNNSKLMYGDRYATQAEFYLPLNYDIEHVSSDQADLPGLVKELAKATAEGRSYSLFLKGKNGAGKTSLGFYLAEKFKMEAYNLPLEALLSDSPMVSAEQKLRSAFTAAADDNGLLILENAGALSMDGRSLEKLDPRLTKMLTERMSKHRKPVVIIANEDASDTTADFEKLMDKTINFKALSSDQASRVARSFTGEEIDTSALPKNVVVGDFATVASTEKKGLVKGSVVEQVKALSELKTERRGIGF